MEDLLLDLYRGFRPVEVPQLILRTHDAELVNGIHAQFRRFLRLRRGQQAFAVAGDHKTLKDAPLDRRVRGRSIYVGHHLTALPASEDCQIPQRFHLQIRIRLAPRDLGKNLARTRRSALAQHKERLFLQLGGLVSLEELLQHGNGTLGIGVDQTV